MQWNSQAGEVYQLQEALVLTNHPNVLWSDVGSPVVGPTATAIFTNTLDVQHFYRLCQPDICP